MEARPPHTRCTPMHRRANSHANQPLHRVRPPPCRCANVGSGRAPTHQHLLCGLKVVRLGTQYTGVAPARSQGVIQSEVGRVHVCRTQLTGQDRQGALLARDVAGALQCPREVIPHLYGAARGAARGAGDTIDDNSNRGTKRGPWGRGSGGREWVAGGRGSGVGGRWVRMYPNTPTASARHTPWARRG
jgi:hypothetical protein